MTGGFILLASQRTGSTVVWRTLDQHPEVSAKGELFLRESSDLESYSAVASRTWASRLTSRLAPQWHTGRYLDRATRPPPEGQAAGFKLMYSQVPPGFWRWCAQRKPSFIHLQRRNLLKVLVSKAAAEQSGVRHREVTDSHSFGKVDLPTTDLADRLDRLHSDVAAHERLLEGHRVHCAYYEDLLDDPTTFFSELFDFLAVAPMAAPLLSLRKLVPDRLEDAVENADQVREALASTPYAMWVDK